MLSANLFQKLQENEKYRYWLRYFPLTRFPDQVRLAGYSRRKLAEFWTFSGLFQRMTFYSLLILSIVSMAIFSISYMVDMQKYRYLRTDAPVMFWAVLMVSYLFKRSFFWEFSVLRHFLFTRLTVDVSVSWAPRHYWPSSCQWRIFT